MTFKEAKDKIVESFKNIRNLYDLVTEVEFEDYVKSLPKETRDIIYSLMSELDHKSLLAYLKKYKESNLDTMSRKQLLEICKRYGFNKLQFIPTPTLRKMIHDYRQKHFQQNPK